MREPFNEYNIPEDLGMEERETDWSELKVALNNVIMVHGPACVTLADAEKAMLLLIESLRTAEAARLAKGPGHE